MRCPHCKSAGTVERPERTELGYRRFRCRTCKREWNERTGTRYNHLHYPTDIVCLVMLWRVRYELSLRVDVLLSEKRDKPAAEAFFRSARTITGSVPERVTTDGHNSYPGAVKAELGDAVLHRTNRYLNNHLEQDHRGIKQRTRPMGGFKSVESAKRFCRVHDEVQSFLRPRSRRNKVVSLGQRRLLYAARTRILLTSLAAA
jgi:putative transposase